MDRVMAISTLRSRRWQAALAVAATFLLATWVMGTASASHLSGGTATYTLDGDFTEGTLINLVASGDQLQLDETTDTFPFIWVAASARGTIIKIDTSTGVVLGEYRTAPQGMATNPSRTTVDANGNVWAGNRNETSGGRGSVVHVGLAENGQCVDRNGNGVIDTSTGLGDIRGWSNAGSADVNGGVSTAEDECIIHFVRTNGIAIRHVSVDGSNNVWAGGGYGTSVPRFFDQISSSGTILRSINMTSSADTGSGSIPCCYGGLVDADGILWSAGWTGSFIVRIDPSLANGTPGLVTVVSVPHAAYGLAADSEGNIWVSHYSNARVSKVSKTGTVLGTFGTGSLPRGVAVTADDNVWVANTSSNTVTRLTNAGTLVAHIPVGSGPTGVSVDADGNVWSANMNANTASRIDPATNTVDMTVSLGAGAGPYNYSDMTGSTITAPPSAGTWTIVHDSGVDDAPWGNVSWNASTPGDSSIAVSAASSTDASCTTFNVAQPVTNGVDLTVDDGQCLRIVVNFTRASTGESPILTDLTVAAFLNEPPTADAGGPYTVDEGSSVTLDASGSSDPDGDPLTYEWDLTNDGNFGDASGVTVTFDGIDGPSVHTVSVRVCDPSNECDVATTTVTVLNVPPTADAGANQTVLRNQVVSLSGTWTDPAGAADAPYDWSWDLDGDGNPDISGSTAYGDVIGATTSFALPGLYTLTFSVTDKDGGSDSATVVIEVVNQAPSCGAAAPSIATIWPPNHQMVDINILGVTDDDGDSISIVIDSIFQDEPVFGVGDGNFGPDGAGVGTSTAQVRAERSGRATAASTTSASRLTTASAAPAPARCRSASRSARAATVGRSTMARCTTRPCRSAGLSR
jgi:streptogramin lyase